MFAELLFAVIASPALVMLAFKAGEATESGALRSARARLASSTESQHEVPLTDPRALALPLRIEIDADDVRAIEAVDRGDGVDVAVDSVELTHRSVRWRFVAAHRSLTGAPEGE